MEKNKRPKWAWYRSPGYFARISQSPFSGRGGRVVQRCWVNFWCRGVLLIWITVGQGPIVLAVGAAGGCLDIFSLTYHFSFLSPSLWETARYRLKYCLKGPLSPKQPTNQPFSGYWDNVIFMFSFIFSKSKCRPSCSAKTKKKKKKKKKIKIA